LHRFRPIFFGDFDVSAQYLLNIPDVRSGSICMTRVQGWIYRDPIDHYYDRGGPLADDDARLCFEIGARSDEERAVVAEVLNWKFEPLEEGGYKHVRCEYELAMMGDAA
jgi:uncharacterized protein YdaU (DUF1376 family)